MLEKDNKNIAVLKKYPKCTRCGAKHIDFYCMYHKTK